MLPITFTKERATYFFDCLINGRRIEPDPEGWTVDDTLQLAGACLLALAAYGPEWRRSLSQGKVPDHPEYREAEIDAMMGDLHAAVEVTMQLTQLAYDGEYDAEYEPVVQYEVEAVDTYVEASVVPVKGFKEP